MGIHPSTYAECQADGTWIICHTGLVFTPVNEPILDFQPPCGTLYETSTDIRRGRTTWSGCTFVRGQGRCWDQAPRVAEVEPAGAGQPWRYVPLILYGWATDLQTVFAKACS
jgi:hypothetical protein